MNVRFVGSETVAKDTVSFYFQPDKPLDYTAGQFIDLTIPHAADDRSNRRWFTLSSSPTEEHLAVTTRLSTSSGSSFKRALTALKPGDSAVVSDPMGDFVLPKAPTVPITFVAGGIGITPVRSMIKWLYDTHEKRPVDLIYAVSTQEHVAFEPLFSAYGIKKEVIMSHPEPNWQGKTGRINAARVLELAPDNSDKFYYLSGPEPLVEELVAELADHGVERSRLVTDFFLNYTTI